MAVIVPRASAELLISATRRSASSAMTPLSGATRPRARDPLERSG